MKIIRMTGGLGNQMFQYALYLKYISMGYEAVFEDFTEYDEAHDNRRPIQLDVFGIDYPRVDMKDYYRITDSFPGLIAKVKRKLRGRKNLSCIEASNAYDEAVLSPGDAYVMGYFQSEKYFYDVKDKVLKSFAFKQSVEDEAKNVASKNNLLIDDFENDNSVSIHIRRGDYLSINNIVGGICTEDYYDRSISYIIEKVENPHFYIFTNDSEYANSWAQKYTGKGIYMHVVEGNTEDSGYIDMYLMSLCHHHVIANSSFSWWGAYINKKDDSVVVAPSRWINGADNQDIYTRDMIKI